MRPPGTVPGRWREWKPIPLQLLCLRPDFLGFPQVFAMSRSSFHSPLLLPQKPGEHILAERPLFLKNFCSDIGIKYREIAKELTFDSRNSSAQNVIAAGSSNRIDENHQPAVVSCACGLGGACHYCRRRVLCSIGSRYESQRPVVLGKIGAENRYADTEAGEGGCYCARRRGPDCRIDSA